MESCKDTKSKHKLGSDLGEILEKRLERSESTDSDEIQHQYESNIQAIIEVSRMSREEVKAYKDVFRKYDRDSDDFLGLEDLKLMMESLGAPQTHIRLKAMIKEVDADGDSKINFHEFLLIFHKAKSGQLDASGGLSALAKLTEVDINKVGVYGAKHFFEAKIGQLKSQDQIEGEMRKEQVERRELEQKEKRKRKFQEKQAIFEQVTLNI